MALVHPEHSGGCRRRAAGHDERHRSKVVESTQLDGVQRWREHKIDRFGELNVIVTGPVLSGDAAARAVSAAVSAVVNVLGVQAEVWIAQLAFTGVQVD